MATLQCSRSVHYTWAIAAPTLSPFSSYREEYLQSLHSEGEGGEEELGEVVPVVGALGVAHPQKQMQSPKQPQDEGADAVVLRVLWVQLRRS